MELGRRSSVLQCEEKFNDGVKGAQVLRKWGGNNKKEKCSPASRSTFSGEICKSRLRALNISFAAAFFLRSRRSGSLRLTISAPDHLQSFITKPMQTTNRQRLSVYGADAFCEIGFGDEKKRALLVVLLLFTISLKEGSRIRSASTSCNTSVPGWPDCPQEKSESSVQLYRSSQEHRFSFSFSVFNF